MCGPRMAADCGGQRTAFSRRGYSKMNMLYPTEEGGIQTTYKQMKLDQRILLEQKLAAGESFAGIARDLGVSAATISREVRRHAVTERSSKPNVNYNNCKNRFGCQQSNLCDPCKSPRKFRLCRRCSYCSKVCGQYEPDTCIRHIRPPYVCNGCGKRMECSLEQHYYHAEQADAAYRKKLSEARTGISLSEEQLQQVDSVVSPLIKQHQSPHHICVHNRDRLMISERTLYTLISSRAISAMNMDLPRKTRFKPRRKKAVFKVDRQCRAGRDYPCFKSYMEEHPDSAVVQLDSVEGVKGGKVLLTIHFVKCEMMLAFLRDSNDSRSVTDIFEALYVSLGADAFSRLFHVLLADNGSEFSNPAAIEFGPDGVRRAHFFYCDPSAPYQKGSCERNHEFIRCFIPKGKDLGLYSQQDITLMMDHINSYCRNSLGDKCPYDAFRFFYSDKLLTSLGCTRIPPQLVTLGNSIWKEKQ